MTKPYPFFTEKDFNECGAFMSITPLYAVDLANIKLSKMFQKGYTLMGNGVFNNICSSISSEKQPADTHEAYVLLVPLEAEKAEKAEKVEKVECDHTDVYFDSKFIDGEMRNNWEYSNYCPKCGQGLKEEFYDE